MPEIRFYRVNDVYGYFSNFAPYPILLDGKTWPTSEHYFQAQKFVGQPDEEDVRCAASPGQAARMGRERTRPLRKDWEIVKEDVMRAALYAKFTQYAELRAELLATADALLIEHTTNDAYWADGGDGSGKNRLGILLMELRTRLQAESPVT
jgi:N-glycosidase YbiA